MRHVRLVGVIDGFRWSILGDVNTLSPLYPGASILATGLRRFHHTERTFADVI